MRVTIDLSKRLRVEGTQAPPLGAYFISDACAAFLGTKLHGGGLAFAHDRALDVEGGSGRHVAFTNSSCTVYEVYTCVRCRQVYI